jgi:hypothetical protein
MGMTGEIDGLDVCSINEMNMENGCITADYMI